MRAIINNNKGLIQNILKDCMPEMNILRKYRRGQIRGIDFSLSMIIFLLTLTQVLILTNNFIISNRTYQDSIEGTIFADSLARDIVFTSGQNSVGNDWMNTDSATLSAGTWDFGLSTDGFVDPYKMGRLSNWSIPTFLLDYDTVSKGLNLQNKKFSIDISSVLDVNITTVVLNPDITNIDITGEVNIDGSGLSNANVHIFAISSDVVAVISEIEVLSSNSGIFTASLDMTGAGANSVISFVAIVRYGDTSQGTDIFNLNVGTPAAYSNGQITVLEAASSTEGYSVDVRANNTANTANLYGFYNLGISPSVNYTSAAMVNNGDWEANDFQIPQVGMTVLLMQEFDAANNMVNLNILTFPALLDDNMGNVLIAPSIPNAISSVASIPFEVRGILMIMTLTTWG